MHSLPSPSLSHPPSVKPRAEQFTPVLVPDLARAKPESIGNLASILLKRAVCGHWNAG